VVYVPLQAVTSREGKQVVFRPGSERPTEVETGDFTDEFIEIRKGLAAGDSVLLRTPSENKAGGENKSTPEAKPAESTKETAAH